MHSIKRSNATCFSPALSADEANKRRRLQEPASGQLLPTNPFSHEFQKIENILWSDDYDTHEASQVAATVAEYEAMLRVPDSATPNLERSCTPGNSLENILWSDDYDAHEASLVAATLAEYEALLLNTDADDTSAERDQGSDDSTSLRAERQSESKPYRFLTSEQRQAILNSFKDDPNKTDTSIADEIGFSRATISKLRKRLYKTGDMERRESSKRLTSEQRLAILNIFKTDPKKTNVSIADEFRFSPATISSLRERFNKTGNIEPLALSQRLTSKDRQDILNIFKTDPKKNNASIAAELGFNISTIKCLRNQFYETGNINEESSRRRLTFEQRQAILNIFKTDPKRSDASIAGKFGLSRPAISNLRSRFNKTGKIDSLERKKSPAYL